jgi:magnesium transporter
MDDAMAVIESEHTKDLAVNAAVTPSGLPYLQTGVLHHSRNRIVWLLFLMVSAMFTGGIISAFETQLAAVTALIAFIPMLMDTGGNAGSQTSTLVIRGMALGEISGRDVLKVWWKEVRIALVCGLVLGIVNFVRIIVIDGFLRAGGLGDQIIRISTVVSLTLCCTLVLAKSLGCLLPILAKRFRLDPAIMAAPLITTIADALSLLTYFGIASILLGL